MPNAKFNLVQDNGDSAITLYHNGETFIADSSHPRWDDILRLIVVEDNPADAVELFDVARLLRRMVMSERVTVTFNAVLFDNDPVHDSLAEHIVRLVNEGEEVSPWVRLLENIKQNPNPESVDHLYRHLSRFKYTVTSDGMILAYKGVSSSRYDRDAGEGTYYSTRSGHAIVNGEEINDYVPQRIGDVVEMPRSEVTFNPAETCSYGLHVADWNYAKTMGNTVLAVLVNPRDVVSVPNDHGDAKVRVCRYKVLEARTEPYEGAVLKTDVTVSIAPSDPEPDPVEDTYQPGDRVYNIYDDLCGTVLHRRDYSDGTEAYVVEWDDDVFQGLVPIQYEVDELLTVLDGANDDDESSSETTEEEIDVATGTRYRYPSPAKFDELVGKAKAQKKGVKSFIQKRTNWTLIDGRGDGSDRKDWAV